MLFDTGKASFLGPGFCLQYSGDITVFRGRNAALGINYCCAEWNKKEFIKGLRTW